MKLGAFLDHNCIKCGGAMHYLQTYHPTRFGNASCAGLLDDVEHLHRNCQGCGFEWIVEVKPQ